MRSIPTTLLLGLACALPGLARAADPEMCRDGSITFQTPIGLAKATGAPRTYLRSDTAPCPNETPACRGRAYVVPGDLLMTGVAQGRYICALFAGKGGNTYAGYVLQDELAPQPVSTTPPVTAWVGKWRNGDDTITLRAKGNQLVASGNAYWPSANPSLKERPGGPNLGEMGGTATPQGNRVVFADKDPDACQVTLTLAPPFLAVTDNSNCGGMNVSFTGTYQKR